MKLIAVIALGSVFASVGVSATALNGVLSDTDLLRQQLLNTPNDPEFDFNGDGKIDVADLVISLNADNTIYLRPDIRYDAMQEAVGFVSTLASMELSEKNAAIMTWLDNHPLFDEHGISSEEAVWATFTDGLPILFVDNRNPEFEPEPVPQENPVIVEPEEEQGLVPTGAPQLNLVVDPLFRDSELPFGRRVEIINAFGNGWQAQRTANDLVTDFLLHGYDVGEVTRIGDANRTIADLKRIGRCDVMYLGGHGGTGWFDSAPLISGVTGSYFSVSTSDVVQQSELVLYANEIMAKEIVPEINTSSDDSNGNAINATYWAITENFVNSYFQFGSQDYFNQNSLVVVDACSSANQALRYAFYDQGAATYMGWSVPVNDWPAARSMDHFFGRLLGEDSRVSSATTNVRPFDVMTTYREMSRLNLTITGGATLKLSYLPQTDFSILRPMLHNLLIYPDAEEMLLYGVFGNNQTGASEGDPKYPVVTVDGHEVEVLDWSSFELKCTLPATGPGSIGEVEVVIDGLRSNAIPITEFSGVGSYTSRWFDSATVGGSLVDVLTTSFDFRSRMSIHPYRIKPDLDPVWPWINVASLPSDDDELFKFYARHREALITEYGHLDGGTGMGWTQSGPVDFGGCEGTVSGSGSLTSIAVDPFTEVFPSEPGFYGRSQFISQEDTPDDVTWALTMVLQGITATFTPGPECPISGPEEYVFDTSISNGSASVMVDTNTFEVPAGSWNGFMDFETIEWESFGPCCDFPYTNLPN